MDSIPLIIINKYKAAWEHHSIELLESIFSNNIIYQEKSCNIIVGLQNLKKYWIENSKKQLDVRFKVTEFIYYEHNVVLDWEAHFYDTKTNLDTCLKGIMWIKLDESNRIYHLKEFFNINRNEH